MARGSARRLGWFPLQGSWEEAVLSWNEQIDLAVRNRRGALPRLRKDAVIAVSPPTPESAEESIAAGDVP